MIYPAFEYVRQEHSNSIINELINLIEENKDFLQEIRDAKHTKSQDVEKVLGKGLGELGFIHSATINNVSGLFNPAADFEIDFFSQELEMAIEVEKGRNFNIWKDICKLVESPRVKHGVLIIPYKKTDSKGVVEPVFHNTIRRIGNVEQMLAELRSVLVMGY